MKSWVLAVGLLAAAMSGQAWAADLDGPSDRYGSAYDDPRYSDMYRYPDKYTEVEPYGRRPYDREDYRGYQRHSYRGGDCVPRELIRHRLHQQGWHDFRDIHAHGDVAHVVARRPSGRHFELTIDRCSGEVVNLRRLRPYGPYAYGGPHRRY